MIDQRTDVRDREISLTVEEGAPDVIDASRDLLTKVFLNLGINAIEAGGRMIRFHLAAGRSGGLQILVDDDGGGMDEETRARAFNPFFTTKTREGGLGLALVRKIIDGHRGTIEIESSRGEGTRFRLWFPVRTGTPDESASVSDARLSTAEARPPESVGA